MPAAAFQAPCLPGGNAGARHPARPFPPAPLPCLRPFPACAGMSVQGRVQASGVGARSGQAWTRCLARPMPAGLCLRGMPRRKGHASAPRFTSACRQTQAMAALEALLELAGVSEAVKAGSPVHAVSSPVYPVMRRLASDGDALHIAMALNGRSREPGSSCGACPGDADAASAQAALRQGIVQWQG